MHVKEFNTKNLQSKVCSYYFDKLAKAQKLWTKIFWLMRKAVKTLWFVLLDIFTVSQWKC